MLKLTLLDEAFRVGNMQQSLDLFTIDRMIGYVQGYLNGRGVPLTTEEAENAVSEYLNQVEF